uniref:TNase-like domain-containing protein n=1 Tax=Timspurckia oligopyrenoides TaxID=708627 RepID=A0A7S1EQF4_9RHOD|mmetsp:Transcript_1276/g.2348  ORF Transcript_1276/g.2348 Transcript_1276/m.2348 type:complete len:358 (+) Transcript_1276:63-1136(+)
MERVKELEKELHRELVKRRDQAVRCIQPYTKGLQKNLEKQQRNLCKFVDSQKLQSVAHQPNLWMSNIAKQYNENHPVVRKVSKMQRDTSKFIKSKIPNDEFSKGAGYALVGVAAIAFVSVALYRGLYQVKSAEYITQSMLNRRAKLSGVIVKVGDGDNFRMLHTPSLRRIFNWFKRNSVANETRKLSETTIHVRLAGVDAPECAHFGQVGQKHGPEALEWLRNRIQGKRVTIQVLKRDQYERVVATAWVKPSWWRRQQDVSYELVRAGYGVVYRGGTAVYNGALKRLESAERIAQKARRGMWVDGVDAVVGPQQYKKALKLGLESAEKLLNATQESGKVKSVTNGILDWLSSKSATK